MDEEKGMTKYAEVKSMAKVLVESNLFKVGNPHQVLTLMLLCQSEGLHPMKVVQRYDIIEGKPAMKPVAMLADFRQRGGRVEMIEKSDKACVIKFTHPNGDTHTQPFTIEDAAKIKVYKKNGETMPLTNKFNWRNYPRAMLFARCVSEGIRTIMPEIVAGVYTADEVEGNFGQKYTEPKEVEPIEIKDINKDPALDNESAFKPETPSQEPENKKRTRAGKNEPTKPMMKKLFVLLGGDDATKHAELKQKHGLDSFKELSRDTVAAWIDELENDLMGAPEPGDDPFGDLDDESDPKSPANGKPEPIQDEETERAILTAEIIRHKMKNAEQYKSGMGELGLLDDKGDPVKLTSQTVEDLHEISKYFKEKAGA